LRGPDDFAGLLHAMGMPFPYLLASITILTEIAGGILVIAGALVPLVSVPMAVVLVVAIFTVHLRYGFSSIKLQEITPNGARFGQPGYETDLLYLVCIVVLVIGGWMAAAQVPKRDLIPSGSKCLIGRLPPCSFLFGIQRSEDRTWFHKSFP